MKIQELNIYLISLILYDMPYMLESLISSKTRIKILLKFFLNIETSSHLRSLAAEFDESSNAIRLELNRFEAAGLLTASISGNKKIFQANPHHPLFLDIQNLVRKHYGIDQIIEQVISKIGHLNSAWITGDFARGIDSSTMNVLLVGKAIKHEQLNSLIAKVEGFIPRKISCQILSPHESLEFLAGEYKLLIWGKEIYQERVIKQIKVN